MSDDELLPDRSDIAQVIPFPFAQEPINLRCACGSEWWNAKVVFMEDMDLLYVAGWYGVIKCDECGAERNLNAD